MRAYFPQRQFRVRPYMFEAQFTNLLKVNSRGATKCGKAQNHKICGCETLGGIVRGEILLYFTICAV